MLLGQPLAGQAIGARSGDYLFASTAHGVRSLWLNPAGLAAEPEASLMGELVFERLEVDDVRLSQWTVGFNSSGLSFGYQRDRLVSDSSNQAFRFGLARSFATGSIGLSWTLYRSDSTQRGLDVGLRVHPSRTLDLGLVVRNVGQPRVRGVRLPVTGVGAIGWTSSGSVLAITGEALAQNRFSESGYDIHYRAGVRLSIGGSIPIAAMAAVALASDLDVDRWSLGIAVGGDRRAVMVGTVVPGAETPNLNLLSLTGLAVNRFRSRLSGARRP